MAGPKPDDTYSAVPSISPTTSSGGDLLNVRASPEDFGAQVGQAVQGLGQTLNKVGTDATDLAVQRMGQINETLANQANMSLDVVGGEIYNKYKSLTGLDAVAGRESAVSAYTDLFNKTRASLPSDAARRAFDSVAMRSTGFALRDMNGYAAVQQKQAYVASFQNSAQLAVDSTSSPDIARDPTRFGYALGTMKVQLISAFTQDQGYGTVTHLDNKGNITFDDSDDGKRAEAAWTVYYNKYLGQAYINKYDTLSDPVSGDPVAAMRMFQADRATGRIPPPVAAQIAARLNGPYKSAQTRNVANDFLSGTEAKYLNDISGSVTGHVTTPVAAQAFLNQESGNRDNIPDSPTGNIGPGQLSQSLFNAFAKPGENIRNATDNRAVTTRVIDHYLQEYHGDIERAAVAYYSGEPNVRPLGEDGPAWKEDKAFGKPGQAGYKTTSQYVSDIVGKVTQGGTGMGSGYMSKADWYEKNIGTISADLRTQAEQQFPNQPELADQAYNNGIAKIQDVIRQGHMTATANFNTVVGSIEQHHFVAEDQLLQDPATAQAYRQLQRDAPLQAENIIHRILPSYARGIATTYGTDAWNVLGQIHDGTINSENDLWSRVNTEVAPAQSPLTNTGVKQLKQFLELETDPKGKTFLDNAYNWINGPHVRGAMVPSSSLPGSVDPKFNNRFDGALRDMLPKLLDGYHRGISFSSMTDPKSKDFVGGAIHPMSQTEATSAMINSAFSTLGAGGTPEAAINLTKPQSLDDLSKAIRAGTISDADATALARKFLSGVTDTGPTPPMEH